MVSRLNGLYQDISLGQKRSGCLLAQRMMLVKKLILTSSAIRVIMLLTNYKIFAKVGDYYAN